MRRNWILSLGFLSVLLTTGCGIIGSSKRMGDPYLAWSGPDQRSYRTISSWGCFSATGSCSSVSWRSHTGRSLSIDYKRLKAYIREAFWDDALFHSFVQQFGPQPLSERHPGLETWQQGMLHFSSTYCGTLPYKVHIVSVNPDIAVVSKDFDCIIGRVFHYSYEKTPAEAIERYQALLELYPSVTPQSERQFTLASAKLKEYEWYLDRSLGSDTQLPYRAGEPVWIIYLDQWRHQALAPKWPQTIQLAEQDYLHFSVREQQLEVTRTQQAQLSKVNE
ncbi:MAG: hypothetical protein HWE13_01110 [Gammaproteobacteria bacterium]|nr:hypothetical protein [Gammaproteobacteria bacterium]